MLEESGWKDFYLLLFAHIAHIGNWKRWY